MTMFEFELLVAGLVVIILLCCLFSQGQEQPSLSSSGGYYVQPGPVTLRIDPRARHNAVVGNESRFTGQQYRQSVTGIDRRKAAANHKLVQILIRNFQHQRIPDYKYQFAVLFVSSETDIKFRVRGRNGRICIPAGVTDSRYSIFPPDSQVYNYLTARPTSHLGYTLHAEAQLMEKFHVLQRSCEYSNRRFVVLFTWLLPCWRCAQRITSTLSGDSPNVSLFYISKMQDVSDEEERRIVAYLEEAGLRVIPETSDEVLLPAGQI